MNRMILIAAASAIALGGCEVRETGNDAAAIDADAALNAGTANTATPAAAPTDPDEGISYGPGPDSLPPGAQLAVLHGDPAQAGMFIIRLKLPPGYAVPPHSHPSSEYVTVISGTSSLGMGDTLDRGAARTLGPGGFIEAPANMNHYAFTDSGATVQITAEGPFAVKYVNPADDPRNKTN